MSKAKELAREVISQMEEIQRQVMNNNSLSGFTKDWQSGFNHAMIELRNRLNDAVLSEPEPLKGWIEVEYHNSPTAFLPINQIMVNDWSDGKCSVVPISFLSSDRYNSHEFMAIESYDSIKQKIRGAS